MKTTLLSTLLALLTTAPTFANIDLERAEKNTFDVVINACTADAHTLTINFKVANNIMNDFPPDGYLPANNAELRAAMLVGFSNNYRPYIAKMNSEQFAADGIGTIYELGLTKVPEVYDDKGNLVPDVSLIDIAMNETKQEMMKAKKYTGMGIFWMKSTVTVDTSVAGCQL